MRKQEENLFVTKLWITISIGACLIIYSYQTFLFIRVFGNPKTNPYNFLVTIIFFLSTIIYVYCYFWYINQAKGTKKRFLPFFSFSKIAFLILSVLASLTILFFFATFWPSLHFESIFLLILILLFFFSFFNLMI